MNLREFYEASEGSYQATLGRIMKEERIIKYLRKFVDSNSLKEIRDALDAKNYEAAFRGAHNLKGLCMNLGLDKLQAVSSDLTESLRNGPTGDEEGLYEEVAAEYERVLSLIRQLDD